MTGLGGIALSDWMVDTFIYTSLLIGVVLLIRRRVAAYFGPQIAYALWALPLLRFIMPPLVLPAWMKPAEPAQEAVPAAASEGGQPLMVFITDAPESVAGTDAAPAAAPWLDLSVTDILLPLWLGGAVLFLIWRARDYAAMRRDLLAQARPVGEADDVRLVETPAVSAPVAFGISDKVVALPPEFMDRIDVTARDMAIAHELEHHRGRDLLANIAAQPLLALHWFNPLAWWGWRAMRRDQEAACDARVVAGRARSERAAYAEVIAGFAAGEHLALAAPMACPVLGEKSIIHRLRSLTMTDISSRRRKLGIAALATTAMALPLTASISYAQAEPVDPPSAPAAPEAPSGPAVPQPPAPPTPPDPDSDPEVEIIETENGQRIIIRTESNADGEHRVVRRVITRTGNSDPDDIMSAEEIAIVMAEVEEELEGLDEEIEQQIEIALAARSEAGEIAGRRLIVVEDGEQRRFNLDGMDCDDGESFQQRELGDGRRAMVICSTNIEANAQAQAATSLRAALEAIENNPDISEETRREIRREMERAIQEMEAAFERVSFRIAPAKPMVLQPARVDRVVFGFTERPRPAPAAIRIAPMAHPLTGRVQQSQQAEEECDESTQVRLPGRATA